MDRNDFLKTLGAGIATALLISPSDLSAVPAYGSEAALRIMIPRSYDPPTNAAYSARLKRAVLETLQTHYSTQNIPVWKKPFRAVNLEVRVHWITHWLMIAIQQHRRVYPVDPSLIMAMVMKESYFYEFAVSTSLAVGICQFVQPTAQEYQMLCAGTRDAHGRPPYRLPEYAGKVAEYYRLRQERRQYYRNSRPKKRFTLRQALDIITANDTRSNRQAARTYLDYLKTLDNIDERRRNVRDQFRQYIEANVAGRDLFDRSDLNFILGFDERLTYKKPLSGMVLMMARHLRARNGNVLASVVGYNAGLSTTRDIGRFKPYGRVPNIRESTEYISHVLVNHHEINTRI